MSTILDTPALPVSTTLDCDTVLVRVPRPEFRLTARLIAPDLAAGGVEAVLERTVIDGDEPEFALHWSFPSAPLGERSELLGVEGKTAAARLAEMRGVLEALEAKAQAIGFFDLSRAPRDHGHA
jgi:hypothetical protein